MVQVHFHGVGMMVMEPAIEGQCELPGLVFMAPSCQVCECGGIAFTGDECFEYGPAGNAESAGGNR